MSQPSPEQATAPKRRSPVERLLVWAVIAGLLVVVAIEGYSHWKFSRAYQPLVSKLRAAEQAGATVKEEEVRGFVGGIEPSSRETIYGIMRTANREDAYVYRGLLKNRTMYVYYGVGRDPDVLFVTNVKEPKPAEFDWEAFGYVRADQPADAVSVQPVSSPGH